MSRHQIDAAAADATGVLVGKVGSIGGGASAFLFGMSAEGFAAICGVFIALIGLAVQGYYSHRRDKREAAAAAEESAARAAEREARLAGIRASFGEPRRP